MNTARSCVLRTSAGVVAELSLGVGGGIVTEDRFERGKSRGQEPCLEPWNCASKMWTERFLPLQGCARLVSQPCRWAVQLVLTLLTIV